MSGFLYYSQPDGSLVSTKAENKAAAERAGWKPVSSEAFAAAKAKNAEDAEAASHPVEAGGEGLVKGAVDTFAAPATAIGGIGEAAFGKNPVSSAVTGLGENALAALHTVGSYAADIPSAISEGRLPQAESYEETEKYTKGQRARAEANPLSSGAGKLAGTLAGFGPLGALGGAAGGAIAGDGAGLAARLAGAAARGATEMGTLSLADQTEEARLQDTALTAKQAIYSAGLGALFGGTLNFAGKAAGEFFSASKAARAAETALAERRGTIPDLEPPQGPLPAPVGGGVSMRPEIPDLQGEGPATVRAPPLPPEADLAAESNAKFNDSDLGRGVSTPRPAGAPEMPTVPAPATSNAEVMAGGVPSGLEPEPRPDLDVQGGEDFSKALRRESFEASGRAKKVGKLLDAIPEGAHPDWVLKMSPSERGALAEMVGVKDPSDKTWRALADALADREGFSVSPALEAAPATASGDLENQLRASLADKAGAPRNGTMLPPELQPPTPPAINAPAPGTYQGPPRPEGPVPSFSPPPVGPQPAPGAPYQPPVGADALIPPEEYGPALSQPVNLATPEGKAWNGLLGKLAKYGARKMAGKAMGAMLGGSVGGIPGVALGMAAGHAVDKMFAASAMQRMAQKGVTSATRAVEGALDLGERTAVSAGESPFFRAGKTPEAAYQSNVKQLESLNANNGRLLTDRIAKAFGPLTDPAAINAVTETARRGIEYLLAKVPVQGPDPGSLTPMADAPAPSRSAIAEYADISDTVLYPKTFEEAVKNGTVTAPMVDAMRAVHPELYEQFQQDFGRALAARDAKDKPILGPERRVASTALGIAQGIDSNKFANKYAQGFALLASSPPADGKKGGSGRKLKGKSMFSAGASPFSTQTNQILSNP